MEELLDKIRNTQNEDLLLFVKDNVDFYEADTQQNNPGLPEDDYNELIELVEEPVEKDTTSFDEFKCAMQQWRMN